MKKKIAFYTLGCKVNTYESESLYELFKNDFDRVDFKEKADVYIINTCTVTNTADSKSRKIIRNALSRKHSKIVCVLGCFSQNKANVVKSLGNVDIILGNADKQSVYKLVMQKILEKSAESFVNVIDIFKVKDFESQTASTFENTRAFLKIQDGCNAYCSYCIIPFVRGNIRCRSKDDTLNEVDKIVKSGYKEIVLSGIHTGKYQTIACNQSYDLKDLVADILRNELLKRLRISSIEINEISDELIFMTKNNNRLAKHFHIPLQAGSDEILKLMNRKYKLQEFYDKIIKIRSNIPDISLTTDIIVGFPGETDELFEETLKFCKKIGFYEIHVFPYSKRDHTKAANFNNQIDEKIKKERVHRLTNLSKELKFKHESTFIGKQVEVIIEKIDENNIAMGHSSQYLKIYIDNENLKSNDFILVEILNFIDQKLIGKFIKFID